VTVSDEKERKVYMSEVRPLPLSDRTFTAMTVEDFATPYGLEATVPAQ